MKKSTLIALSGLALGATTTAFAGSVKTGIDGDITLSGAATSGYFYGANTGSDNNDNFVVSDFMLELSSEEAKTGGVSFAAGFGRLAQVSLLAPEGANVSDSLQYASLTYVPVSNLSIEAGVLATNVGAELAASYQNGNITRGAVWNYQPVFYPGARVSYAIGDMTVYGEVSSPKAYGAGVIGSAAGVDYAVNYFAPDGGTSVIDVVVNSSVAGMDVGVNFDYQKLDSKPAGQSDDSGMGVALYVTPSFGKVDVPVRVEYISDGDSGIYGFDSGTTFTVTPTLNVAKNAFVRVEFSVVSSTTKQFTDKDGAATDSQTGAAFQLGYTF